MSKVLPVILSGGSGTRLWPISRVAHPKQLLQLLGQQSMLQETILRVADPDHYEPPFIVSNETHRFMVAGQAFDIGVTPSCHVLEPFGRNTAPAAAAAALLAIRENPESVLLLLPADHQMEQSERFWSYVEIGRQQADNGMLVTFGIVPEGPETGYGYIKQGPSEATELVFQVAEFIEKPEQNQAQAYIDEGGYFWNSGMFMFRADTFVEELKTHCPKILIACEAAIDNARQDNDFLWLDSDSLAACPSISIDYAVMEKTSRAVVVPASLGWNDIGSWAALWSVSKKDETGNVLAGDVIALETNDCYIRGDSRLVATIGLEDLIVVDTADALLVAQKRHSKKVKTLVDQLKSADRREHEAHVREYRPWGFFEIIQSGDRHKVKHLCVNPGARLSLQKHAKRSEHWVVVKGLAEVTVNKETMTLNENESAYIPLGAEHRLANPGQEALSIIEVQSGTYLGEDDIVRLEDDYDRRNQSDLTVE